MIYRGDAIATHRFCPDGVVGQLPAFSMELGDVCGHGVGNAGATMS